MDLLEALQRLGDAEHDDLEVAHDVLAEIVRLRLRVADLEGSVRALCIENERLLFELRGSVREQPGCTQE